MPSTMPETVICAPVRTAVGRYGGVFKDVPAASLGAAVISAVVKRTGVDPGMIDDVIFGQCYPNGEAPALGRVAALDAGLPVKVPGVQLDRRCGSGLQAVIWAVMQVQTGAIDVVLAGGAESMSQVEFCSPSVRWGPGGEQIVFHDRLGRARVTAGGIHHLVPGGMLETAENLRREYQITRAEQDEFALWSHQRAVAAQEAGRFDDEIVPVEVPDLRRAGTGRPVRAGCLRQP
jgi:acetyl-CoA C-acetyltransferase